MSAPRDVNAATRAVGGADDLDSGQEGGVDMERSGLLSRVMYHWITPLVAGAFRREGGVEVRDIPALPTEYCVATVREPAKKAWAEEMRLAKEQGRRPSYGRVLWRVWKWTLLNGLLWAALVGCFSTVCKPLLLLYLIRSIEDEEERWKAGVYIAGLCISLLLEGVATANTRTNISLRFGSAYLATTSALIQSKALSMSAGAVGSCAQEKALIASDSLKVYEHFRLLSLFPIGVFTLVGGIAVLFSVSGWVCSFGLAIILMVMCLSVYLSTVLKTLEHHALEAADERISITTQIIESIRAIKYSAWEESFLKLVTAARLIEVRFLKRHRRVRMTVTQVGRAAPVLSACATFIGLSLLGQDLRSGRVFAALTVFQATRISLTMVPSGLTLMSSLVAAFERISDYLAQPNVAVHPEPADSATAVAMTEATCRWSAATENTPPLRMEELQVRRGEITAVVGKVGSGKSTLLSALLGDVELVSGRIEVHHDVGYVPQKAFVMCGTVKDNVVMGRPFSEEAFDAALRGSALAGDLPLLPAGVDTAIGERGITLSGGQQQRVAIARALYAKHALLLLDDPLAAVDSAVAAAIFETLKARAAEGSAVVLALNQPHFLPECARIVMLDACRVVCDGDFSTLMAEKGVFHDYVKLATHSEDMLSAVATPRSCAPPAQEDDVGDAGARLEPETPLGSDDFSDADLATPPESATSTPKVTAKATPDVVVTMPDHDGGQPPAATRRADDAEKPLGAAIGQQIFRRERRARGLVANSVYLHYVSSMGWENALGGALLCMLAYCSMGFSDRWLATWISEQSAYREEEEMHGKGNVTSMSFPDINLYAPVYAGGCLLMVFFMILSMCVVTRGCARASKNIHNEILTNLMHAPTAWFQETPSGRIVSRLSSDLGIVDNSLSLFYEHCMNFAFTLIVIAAILIMVLPVMAVVLVLCAVFYAVQVRCVDSTNRDVKRLSNVAMGPVLTALAESIQGQGRTLLRSMRFTAYSEAAFGAHIDRMNRFNFNCTAIIAWQALYCYVLATSLALLSSLYMVFGPSKRDPSEIGLSLTYCFLFPYFLVYFSLVFSVFRLNITSLERLLAYAGDEVDEEEAWHMPGDPPTSWPQRGDVEFRDATLVYREGLPPSLRGVSCKFAAGTRIGVVGRTGAGKSSLLVLLFRLVDAQSGSVLIDGVDVRGVGLQTLRRRLGIIPQEPLLMQGTLRQNLDPFGDHSDVAVRDALARVGMADVPLSTSVGSNAETLSSGQRQLVSIARTLLRKCRIIVLDEPTSSIDPITDGIVQRVIREEFKGATVITIAHRLHTILDSDTIVVMAEGQISEFGPPKRLLANPGSHLSTMMAHLHRDGNA